MTNDSRLTQNAEYMFSGTEALEDAYRLAAVLKNDPRQSDVTLSRQWFLALTDEIDRMANEIMRHQVGESYEVGHEHGVLAGLAKAAQIDSSGARS